MDSSEKFPISTSGPHKKYKMIIEFLLTILIVGIVTSGLNIKFDRFFAILLLIFLFGFTIFDAVNIFLWIIMLGSLMILIKNKEKISELPKNMKIRLFVLVPFLTLLASLLGSYMFSVSPQSVLMTVLGILAALYGLRLIFIHFKEQELQFEKGHPKITKGCGFFGPIVSGLSIGFIGTSLKSLKIPFAIKIGKMNSKQVYLGNAITAFFASSFAIIFHFLLKPIAPNIFYQQMLLGMALWTGMHYTSELTDIFFKNKWKKIFQILIGIILMVVSIKIFMSF